MRQTLLILIIRAALKAASPILRKALEQALLNLYDKAQQTDNEWDDTLIEAIMDLLKIDY